MGCFAVKVVEGTLFVFFVFMAMATPLPILDSYLPPQHIPKSIIDLKTHYTEQYGDYLVGEKPYFFMGLVWMQLLVVFPLSLFNLAALLAKSKPSWFSTTCLNHGVCVATSLVAILSELLNSGRASHRLKIAYYSYLGFAILAVLRGVVPESCGSTTKVVNSKKNGCEEPWQEEGLNLAEFFSI